MIEDLSRRDALFVSTYVQTGDAVEACKAAGLGPREASKTLARLMPSIAAAEAAREPEEPAPSLTALERAKAAYALAERENNASAMVSASTLIGRLEGDLDGNTAVDAAESAPVADRDLARTLMSLVRDLSKEKPELGAAFFLALQAMEGGTLVAVSRPGETLVSVANPDLAAAMGGTICTPLETSKGESNGTD